MGRNCRCREELTSIHSSQLTHFIVAFLELKNLSYSSYKMFRSIAQVIFSHAYAVYVKIYIYITCSISYECITHIYVDVITFFSPNIYHTIYGICAVV